MLRVNFTSDNRRRTSRQVAFHRLTKRIKRTSILLGVAFYFIQFVTFTWGVNTAFSQSYSNSKYSWRSSASQIEPSAIPGSEVSSKRADVLLKKQSQTVSTPSEKKRSKTNAGSLKTYRPSVAVSPVISPSSFCEKKIDLDRLSKDDIIEGDKKQEEIVDKEKFFDEFERRLHIARLENEQIRTTELESFKLAEPQIDKSRSFARSPSEKNPFPTASSSSFSLDEEVGNILNTRRRVYFDELELHCSEAESSGEELQEGDDEYQSQETTVEKKPVRSQNEDARNDVVKAKQRIAETLNQTDIFSQGANMDEEDVETINYDVEEVESSDPEYAAPLVNLNEIDLTEEDETEGGQEENDIVEKKRSENNFEESLENKSQVESDFNGDDEDSGNRQEKEPIQRVEKLALVEKPVSSLPDPKFVDEFDAEENVSTSASVDSDESDVPQTGSLPSTPNESIRHTLPKRSILFFNEEEDAEETSEPTSSPPGEEVEIRSQSQKGTTKDSDNSSEETSDEETGEKAKDEDVSKPWKKPTNESAFTDEVTFRQEDAEEGAEFKTEELSGETNREESSALSNAAVDSSVSVVQETKQKSDDRLLSKLRVLQRGRQRRLFNGRLLETPTPPSVDDIDPEIANQITEPPLLTKENANLPSLDIDGATHKVDKPALEQDQVESFREEAKKFSWTKGEFKIVPYGFLNVSVAADTQRATPGEFILFVQSPEVAKAPDFSVDARTSRLGLKITGPRVETLAVDVNGNVEFDFQGTTNGSRNKGGVQLRRASVELVDAQHDRKLLAGQDWEIISPVAPQVLNYLPLGFVGDMQYRRAQIRYEQGWTCSPDLRVLGQIAACDNVIIDYASTSGVNAAPSGWPILEARLSGAFFGESRGGLPVTLGISGHIGEQNYKFSALAGVPNASTSVKRTIKTWSANFDLDAPITKTQKIQGEVFTGSNLSSFCGGINQGIDLIRREGIRSSGGWLAWHSDFTEKLDVNFGYGIDKPNEKDLVGTSVPSNGYTTARTSNQVFFVNGIYNWTPYFMTGLETSIWQTDYQKAYVATDSPVFYDMEAGKATRIEFVTRLSF